jgi:UDP-glucose 4-epimerase
LTVLVTGGAGYIGSHAAKALSRAGHQVVVFDNLVAGHREAVKYGELVEGDMADTAAVRGALGRFKVDAVLHFAAFLDVSESVREPRSTIAPTWVARWCPRRDGCGVGATSCLSTCAAMR